MTKPGHEMPNNDNRNPADLTSHSDGPQLRIGDPAPEEQPHSAAPDLAAQVLTTEQHESVGRYTESDTVSPQQALLRRVSKPKANRLIGAAEAKRMTESLDRAVEARREAEKVEDPPMEIKVRIMRDTYPDKPSEAA